MIQVDVTNLLSNEIDQQGNYLTPDENESPKKASSNEKYRSLSSSTSSVSTDEGLDDQISNQKIEDKKFANAVDEIQNDLNNLATVIEQASQISNNKKEDKSNEQQRKHIFDEDDDTSRQATQNYDLLDNEQEVRKSTLSLSLSFFSSSSLVIDVYKCIYSYCQGKKKK